MLKSELRKIIKEEVRKILKEFSNVNINKETMTIKFINTADRKDAIIKLKKLKDRFKNIGNSSIRFDQSAAFKSALKIIK